jgi:ADP-ribose pyrophosphatase YjhB (NUDIX family)
MAAIWTCRRCRDVPEDQPMSDNPDLPPASGLRHRLHLYAGRRLLGFTAAFRPVLSFGVRLAAFDRDGRVFLVRHSYVPGFYFPGGGIERGETAREAVVREAREEGGLEFDRPPELFHVYLNPRTGGFGHVILFVARDVRQAEGARPAAMEILEAGVYPLDGLPADVTTATRARLGEITGTGAPSDHW